MCVPEEYIHTNKHLLYQAYYYFVRIYRLGQAYLSCIVTPFVEFACTFLLLSSCGDLQQNHWLTFPLLLAEHGTTNAMIIIFFVF
jgi:hypothetical protein